MPTKLAKTQHFSISSKSFPSCKETLKSAMILLGVKVNGLEGDFYMSRTAYIKLVPASNKQEVSLNDLKDLFNYYKEITSKTGEQLHWNYEHSAFPYEIKERGNSNNEWFYLKGIEDRYHYILLGIGSEEISEEDGSTRTQNYIQIALPESALFGDKNKAIEFAKFLGKKLNGELHLFNGRIMYYYDKK